jgi:cyclase
VLDGTVSDGSRVDSTVTEPSLVPIEDGVHAWIQPDGSWWINNAGMVLGDDGPVLVDTCATERRTRAFLAAVAGLSEAPVRLAVNTHLHGDHTYGNSLLPATTVIVGHPATRDGLLADFLLAATPPQLWSPTPDWGALSIRPPTVVVDDALTVFAGAHRIELRHPGHAAHTRGDLVAWLPDHGVLFTGDLIFHEVTPLVFMGSVDGALRSLEWLASFGASTVVPGHGAVVRDFAPVLAAHERYYRFVLEVAAAGRAEGLDPLRAARQADLGEFAAWPDAERLVLNLHRAYADADGVELDLLAAFADAVAYHGGPLRCAV